MYNVRLGETKDTIALSLDVKESRPPNIKISLPYHLPQLVQFHVSTVHDHTKLNFHHYGIGHQLYTLKCSICTVTQVFMWATCVLANISKHAISFIFHLVLLTNCMYNYY